MRCPCGCRRKSEDLHPFRRIDRGDVPILTNSGIDLPKHRENDYPRTIPSSTPLQANPSQIDDVNGHHKPKNVRRHSISLKTRSSHSGTEQDFKQIIPEKFPNNLVITSRYTFWNFIPKNLFEQFGRVVNFYFLVVAFIQTIIKHSPVHPVTAVSPLCFVVVVTAVKQGYEDWLRHKSDQQVNDRKVRRVREGKLEEIKSKDVQVGDIIKLGSDEQLPTDILVLGSSDEFSRCQINTANLDGETNLKLRYCPSGLPNFRNPKDFDNLHMIVECEHPNADLYEFNGSLLIPADKLSKLHWAPDIAEDLKGKAGGEREHHKPCQSFTDLMKGVIRQGMTDFLSVPLSMDNMALRGTRLKNTEYIYGLVVYTGKDTRLARNSEKSESKFSTVENAVNYYLAFFIGMLLCLVAFCCTMYYLYDWKSGLAIPWYTDDQLGPEHLDPTRILNTLASFIILFNYIIPISLYVTIELQKFLGSKFFVWDNDMVDDEGNEPLCNTSDLNEELGLIEYLFSDKTGTLTQNVMKFRHCSINSIKYELKYEDKQLYQLVSGTQEEKHVNVFTNPNILNFFKTLALCHSVQVVPRRRPSFEMDPRRMARKLADLKILKKAKDKKEKKRSSELKSKRLSVTTPEPTATMILPSLEGMEYQASSPDEKALLESCECLGIVYLGEEYMTLRVNGNNERYKRLMTLEFDADRKCMSVIVQNSKDEIWLLTKGAESSVIPKCVDGPKNETLKHVMDYSLIGLRTLAVAVRQLSQAEFDEFNGQLRAARRLLKNRQEKVREVYMEIENHMTLIGATGVEDQLQENVPETLQSFSAAGIRVWMLTGDKLETGVNVALSCGLINASTKTYIVSHMSDAQEIKTKLTRFKEDINLSSDNTCFVIDGESLSWAFRECADLLRDVSMVATRVVCCRMAPLQKAQVVNMVKNSKRKPICCAVGDGANDCAMILASHIGIGILGKEGRQAARCADFALAKFGHLRKAILVHGHWYYVRLANLANYFFYKNVVFVLPQFFFSFNTNFSTQALFNGLFLMNYNIFFSSCPVFYYGLTEQPYPAEVLLKYPHLYKKNRRNSLMTVKEFLPWFISAIWHAIVVYYIPYFAWDNFDHMNDVMTFGTVVFTGLVIVTNLKMFIETKYISLWYIGSQMYSYVMYITITVAYSEMPLAFFDAEDFRHVFVKMISSYCFWLLMPLIACLGLLPDVMFVALRD